MTALLPPRLRQPVKLSLDADLVARARGLTSNLSGTVETLLTEFVSKAYERQRVEDLARDQVIAAVNAFNDIR
jgi:antitoxin CcdA